MIITVYVFAPAFLFDFFI